MRATKGTYIPSNSSKIVGLTSRHKIISKEILLGTLEFTSTLGLQAKGCSKSTASQVGGWTTTVQVQFVVGIEGELDVEVKEVGASAEEGVKAGSVRLHVPAPLA
jgi:hypothetical protein